ncbi:MAG: class I SAM-dependent methyltransferase [Verrucomicrobiales bacterium]|nr:class I SAM-dependent methyltransferase [Verrucomicrobiales bacterium]
MRKFSFHSKIDSSQKALQPTTKGALVEKMSQILKLRCPLDGGTILQSPKGASCDLCKYPIPFLSNGNREIPDLRYLDKTIDIRLSFTIPQTPLQTGNVAQFGIATGTDFQCISRENIRKLYGTKLQKESLYYIDRIQKQVGTNASILDLGCGNGGNKRYLESIGFHNIISVDYMASGADYLVDVHRLPFAAESFDMILTTATLEHFYNPFIAFLEMSRVLKNNGGLIASGSFWESWHGNSCFHFSPGGISLLCQFAGLVLSDVWSGWGFIPSISSHALGLGRFKRLTYWLQTLFDLSMEYSFGAEASKIHKFRTSGSFGLFAQKKYADNGDGRLIPNAVFDQ